MDLDQLHTFLEIVRLKSFSKAAQTCYRTQPAVSAQVRQLEAELNAPLFERLGTKIALTPAGHIFAQYAEQILGLRRVAQDSINELERVPRGELMIAANEATCIYVLPLVFSEYKKQFPNVQILVDRSYGARVVEAVLDNQADFGITQLPVEEKRLQVVKIHSDEIKALVPAGHPLENNTEVLPEDLVPHALLLPKTGTTRRRLASWFTAVEDDLNVSMELDSTEMIKRSSRLASASASSPGPIAPTKSRPESLGQFPLGPEHMVRQLALIYRKDKALSKAALGFIEVTLKNAAIDGYTPSVRAKGKIGIEGMQRVTLKTSTIFISKGPVPASIARWERFLRTSARN